MEETYILMLLNAIHCSSALRRQIEERLLCFNVPNNGV